MTDRQTDRQTHRQTNRVMYVKNIIPFFKGIKIYLSMDLKIRNMYAVPRAELHTGKIWCESAHNFEVTGQNVILYRWSILNGNGNGSS